MTLIDRVFLISVPKISITSEQMKAVLPAVGNTRSRFFICGRVEDGTKEESDGSAICAALREDHHN